jgi:hypothetical protein
VVNALAAGATYWQFWLAVVVTLLVVLWRAVQK